MMKSIFLEHCISDFVMIPIQIHIGYKIYVKSSLRRSASKRRLINAKKYVPIVLVLIDNQMSYIPPYNVKYEKHYTTEITQNLYYFPGCMSTSIERCIRISAGHGTSSEVLHRVP